MSAMPLRAQSCGGDGHTASVPAKYVVNKLMRDVAGCYDEDATDYMEDMYRILKAKDLSDAAIERVYATANAANSIISRDVRKVRRLGKTLRIHDSIRMKDDSFVVDGYVREVLVLRRERVEFREREIEYRGAPAGTAITRHAVERYYERETIPPAEMSERLKSDLTAIEQRIAFAHAARLMRRPFCDGGHYGTRTPGASGLVPLGDGALAIRSAVIEVKADVHCRHLVQRGGKTDLTSVMHPSTYVHDPVRDVTGYFLTLGATYLSYDLLFPNQREYLAVFEDEMDKHDAAALAANLGRLWMAHEKPEPLPNIKVSTRLHDLLRTSVPKPDLMKPMYRSADRQQSE